MIAVFEQKSRYNPIYRSNLLIPILKWICCINYLFLWSVQCTWCIAQSTMNIIYLPVLFYCSKNHQKSAPYHYKSLQIITTRKSASWRWLSGLLNLTSASISDWTTMREATRNDQVLVFIHTFYILIGIAHAFYRWYCTISGVRTTVTLFEGIEHMFYTCQTVT